MALPLLCVGVVACARGDAQYMPANATVDGGGGGGGGGTVDAGGGGSGGGGGGGIDASGGGGGGGLVDAAVAAPDASTSGTCAMPFSGALATWSFSSQPGSQSGTAASATAPGITASALTRSTGLTSASGANSINASHWATSAQRDPTKYYTFTITPPSGCSISLSSLSIDALSSSTGPAAAAVATGADGFTQLAQVSSKAPSTPPLAVNSASGAVEIRIYGYSAGGASGTMRIQNSLVLMGALQ